MSKEKNSEVLELSVPKFAVPVFIVLVLVLVIFGISSMSGEKENEGKSEVITFSDPGIVPANVDINFEEGAYIGNPETAKYAIVEFSDYKCPYCGMHGRDTFPKIEENYLDGEEVVYVFKEVGIMSDQSVPLSVLGLCIFEHEGADEYLAYRKKAYDVNFENGAQLLDLMEIDSSDVKSCFENSEYDSVIENNSIISQQAGVQGVPGFVIGELSDDGSISGYKVPGAFPYTTFVEVLEALMN